MREATLFLAVVTFVVVATLSVGLHTRASIRSYQLGREREAQGAVSMRIEALRARVFEQYNPTRVHGAAERLRQMRHEGTPWATTL